MEAVLIYPPHASSNEPPVALPLLTAILRKAGIKVKQYDLNCESIDHVLSPDFIRRTYNRLSSKINNGEVMPDENINELIGLKSFLVSSIVRAKEIFRNKRYFFNPKNLNQAIDIFSQAFRLFSAAYTPHKFTYSETFLNIDPKELKSLNALIDLPTIFDAFLKSKAVKAITKKTKLIGFSVNSLNQLAYSLKLASDIKKRRKDIHITIGGTYLCIYKKHIKEFSPFFDHFDSIILHEGEQAILDLTQFILGQRRISDCRNLVFRQGMEVKVNLPFYSESINSLPAPDLSGLPLKKYFCPEIMISLPLARGCYFGKCTFCGYNHNFIFRYKEEDYRLVVSKIKALKNKYGCRHFVFSTSSLSSSLANKLSDELLKQKTNIFWMTQARVDGFDYPLLKKMHRSGCRQLAFGFESSNKRILKLMNKGISKIDQKRILDNCWRSRIMVEVEILYNFLDETARELKETLDFVVRNSNHIAYLALNDFFVAVDSPIYYNPEKFGLIIKKPENDRSLLKLFCSKPRWKLIKTQKEDELEKKKQHLRSFINIMGKKGFYVFANRYLVNTRITDQIDSGFRLLYGTRKD